MKSLNKFVAFATIFAMFLTSCSKDETTTSPSEDPATQSVDLTFGAVLNDLDRAMKLNKDHFDQIPDCSDAAPAYAELEISYDGQAPEDMGVITVDILSENGDYFTDYTEELKIPVPNNSSVTVTLESFVVFDSEGNRIWIAPIETSPGQFDGYVDNPLSFEFEVEDGTKPYIDVEVLCYDRRMANEYGYVFFDIMPEVIYPFCLFLNYCDEDGRHYVANYSVDLYYGPDDSGIQLYDGATLGETEYGMVNGNYFSDPLCLVVPDKPTGLADTDPYLFLVIYPNDWEGNYGDIDNSPIEVQLTWEMVGGLLNDDGETNEYWHGLIGECEGALSGDGSGGNGGNGDNDLDNDGVDNVDDLCPDTPANTPVNADGCPDADQDGVADTDDQCPDTPANTSVDADGCPEDNGECDRDIDDDGICDDVDSEIPCVEATSGGSQAINLDSGGIPSINLYDDGDTGTPASAIMVYAESTQAEELLVEVGLEGVVATNADIAEYYVMISQGSNNSVAGPTRGSYGDSVELALDLTDFDTSMDIEVEVYVIYCDE